MADGRAANAESASNSPGWDDILLRLPGRGAVALRAGAATPVSASLAAAAPPAWGELLLSRDDTTFTHEASAEERTDAATFRLLPPARRSSGAAAERPFNDTAAARAAARRAAEPDLYPDLPNAGLEDDLGGGFTLGDDGEEEQRRTRAATHTERMAALRATNDSDRPARAAAFVMAAPRVAAGRELLKRQRVSSVQALVWALVSCAACASLSAALPSVAACYTVRVFELGSTYVLDIPKLLSCGHPITISPEELSCFAVNTDATARDSAVWIHTDVLDLVHSLVGGGTTLHSAAATRMACRVSDARVSGFCAAFNKITGGELRERQLTEAYFEYQRCVAARLP